MKFLNIFFYLILVTPLWAQTGHREHTAHVHGEARMNLAWSGVELLIELESPAINLLGFEHAVVSAKDRQQLQHAVNTLQQAASLIQPNAKSGCAVVQVDVDSALMDKGTGTDQHADFDVAIEFRCEAIDALHSIDSSELFQAFPGLQKITVQWVSDRSQGARDIDPQRPVISFP